MNKKQQEEICLKVEGFISKHYANEARLDYYRVFSSCTYQPFIVSFFAFLHFRQSSSQKGNEDMIINYNFAVHIERRMHNQKYSRLTATKWKDEQKENFNNSFAFLFSFLFYFQDSRNVSCRFLLHHTRKN